MRGKKVFEYITKLVDGSRCIDVKEESSCGCLKSEIYVAPH